MKILITGAAGFVGCRITRFLSLSHEVVALNSKDLDITDEEQVTTTLLHHNPKAVIHLAGLSNTQYCEQNLEDSEAVNVIGSINVARAAASIGAKLVFASSEQVYNAVEHEVPNIETQNLTPKTVYGRHKLKAEKEILELLPSAVALRLTWMYDIPTSPLPQKTGLFVNLIQTSLQGHSIRCSTREKRGITNVWEVVRRIEVALALPGGIYNFGAPNQLSTYDIQLAAAKALFERGWVTQEPTLLVLPDDTWTRNLSIDLSRLNNFGITFPSTLVGLNNAIQHLRKS